MIKTQIRTACWMVAVLTFAFSNAGIAQDHSSLRIAVVDTQRLVSDSRAGQALQERLESFQDSAEAEIESLRAQARALQERLTVAAGRSSEAEIADLRRQVEEANASVQRRMGDLNREMQQMQNQGLQTIEAQLEPVFEQLQAEMQFDVIFNSGQSGIIKASERVEITDEIIRRYNETFSGL